MTRSLALIAAALLALTSAAAAQDSTGSLVGRRVRIQPQHGATLQGAVVAVSDSAVTLRTSETDTVSVARAGIAKVEVYEGTKSNTGKGALTGLLIGGLTGAVLGAVSAQVTQDSFIEYSAGEGALAYGAALGVLGAGIGALVGSGSHHENWQPAVLPTVTVLPTAQDGKRVAFGLRVSF